MSKIYDALERARRDGVPNDESLDLPLVLLEGNPQPGTIDIDLEAEMISLYQTIRASLPDIDRPAILFTGSHSNEGTSTIAKELAKAASLRIGKSVLLIDFDRSRPDLHVYTSAKAETSVNEVSTDGVAEENTLCRFEESSFYVLPLFQKTMVTPSSLESAKERGFWSPLKERFEFIIVDSPPVTMFPDSLGLAPQVDGVVLVVEAENTRWQVALSVKEKIIKSGGNLLGVVFNKRRYYIPQSIYKYL